jgi:hypothetical protein
MAFSSAFERQISRPPSIISMGGRPAALRGKRAMETDRVENIARALCRSAGFDPDALLPPEMNYALMSPARERLPAWQRFRRAAEVYCQAGGYEHAGEPQKRPARMPSI